jgi:hypothetical protein
MTAVGRDLEEVLARERGRCDEARDDDIIEPGTIGRIHDVCSRRLSRHLRSRPKDALGDFWDARTREPHDGERATTRSRSDRSDGSSVAQRTRIERHRRSELRHAAEETGGTTIDSPGSMM